MTSAAQTSATMRAVVCVANGKTVFERRAVPIPARGEIVLRLRACGLCGTDLFKLAHRSVPSGTVLGHEVVGVVDNVGEGVDQFEPGDRVVVPHHVACGKCRLCRLGSETMCATFRENLMEPGGFSERVLIRERAVRLAARRLPASVSDAAAVFMEPAACVLRGLRQASIGPVAGDDDRPPVAVIVGAGSMGLLHLLVLRAWRPEVRIVVVDPIAERCDLALELGAQVAVTPGEDVARRAVDEQSGGLGADAAFDTAGGPGTLNTSLSLLRPGGSAVLFAHAPEGGPANFDLNELFKNEQRVLGTYSGGLTDQAEVYEMIASGRLDASCLVTHSLPLERFDAAVDLVRRHEALKVLLVAQEG